MLLMSMVVVFLLFFCAFSVCVALSAVFTVVGFSVVLIYRYVFSRGILFYYWLFEHFWSFFWSSATFFDAVFFSLFIGLLRLFEVVCPSSERELIPILREWGITTLRSLVFKIFHIRYYNGRVLDRGEKLVTSVERLRSQK